MPPKKGKSNLSEDNKRLLIEEVDKYPFLYSRGHKEYLNKKLKANAWQDIAKKLDIPSKKYIAHCFKSHNNN